MPEQTTQRRRSDPRIDLLLRETESRLRRQNQMLVDLAGRPSIHSGDLEQALRELTEAAAHTLEAGRVSVWFFSDDHSLIRCADVFDRATSRHASGEVLRVANSHLLLREIDRVRALHD